MSVVYHGPLRHEPLAIELHNTRYATPAGPVDAFDDPGQVRAWLLGMAPRLTEADDAPGPSPTTAELAGLRDAVASVLHGTLDGTVLDPAAVAAVNAAARRAPQSPQAALDRRGAAVPAVDRHGASRADVVLAAFARDAIALITEPRRLDLRACGAPGCVLLFLKDHPRREWCSGACGNRARQARHYRRVRDRAS